MAFRNRGREPHQFSRVPQVECKRSSFDRSHGYKTTFDSGYLIPFLMDEVAPGDTHKVNANMFCRLATLLKPVMDNMYLETFYFFVPFRLLWDNWQRMWGEQDNPGDSTDYLVPVVTLDAATAITGSLWDYMGIPVGVNGLEVSALYPRAYNLIYNQWFRDENLQDSVPITKADTDVATNYALLRRGKRHDYFTSCLPWPQKGPDVMAPLAGILPVDAAGDGQPSFFLQSQGGALLAIEAASAAAQGVPVRMTLGGAFPSLPVNTPAIWDDPKLQVDLEGASAVSINQFREAVVIQQFYEQLARGGSRYTELLQSVYGVTNGDARLQRPEYLGGGRTSIYVNPVVNTAGSAGANKQADLAAYGVASASGGQGHGFVKSFTEHGVIVGLLCVRADLNYQQGVLRQYSRRSKFDFLIPHFAHLGEQAVYNREIYAQGQAVLDGQGKPFDEGVFGYVPRYDDYRFKPSMVTGLFRSNVSAGETSVDFWHLAQDFASLPTLSPEFIVEDPPIERIIAVPSEPEFLLDSWIQVQSVRELPTYSVPGLRRI